MYIRQISDYVNSAEQRRVLVTFQDTEIDELSAMFAVKMADDCKIGSISLKNGYTLEEAKAALSVGKDMSNVFEFTTKCSDIKDKDGNDVAPEDHNLYNIVRKSAV